MRDTTTTTGASADPVGAGSADGPDAANRDGTPRSPAESTPTGPAGGDNPATGPSASTDESAGDLRGRDGDGVAGSASEPTGTGSDDPLSPDEPPDSRTGEIGDPTAYATRPSFTRPPGMLPPPENLGDERDTSDEPDSAPTAAPTAATLNGVGLATPAGDPTATGLGGPTSAGATPVGGAVRTRPGSTPRGPRRARLNLKRVDPWSVMKFSFAVSLVLFIVVIVAAAVLYLALDTMGVFTSINETVADLIQSGGGDGGGTFRISAEGVIGTAAVLGALNVLLFTSLATLGAFIYNVCADLVGGVELTLAERD